MKILASLLATAISVSGASTYYVATNGNNSTGDGSIGNPWRDITNALTAHTFAGGDTLNIRQGIYPEWLPDIVPAGSAASYANATVIQAYNGETVVLNPNSPVSAPDIIRVETTAKHHIIFNGLYLSGTNLVNDGNCVKITYTVPGLPAQFIRFTNCVFYGAYNGMGVLLTSSTDYTPTFCEFLNCGIYGNGFTGNQTPNKHGAYISTSSNVFDGCIFQTNLNLDVHINNGRPSSTIVRNCYFKADTLNSPPLKDSIGLYGGSNNMIYNNVFERKNTGIIINPSDVTTNSYIANNSFWSNGAPIIIQNGASLCGSVRVINNLFERNYLGASGYGFVFLQTGASTTSPIIISNNVAAQSGLGGQIVDTDKQATVGANLTNQGTAGFISTNAPYDYHLRSDSVAIGVGQVQTIFTTDKGGFTRVAPWDAGAFEFFPATATIQGATLKGFSITP